MPKTIDYIILIGCYLITLCWFNIAFSENYSPNKLEINEDKPIFGIVEKVMLFDKRIVINAKIDTGAAMSSLSARNIKIFKIKNKEWVTFTLVLKDQSKKIMFIKPLIYRVKILKREDEYEVKNKNDATVNHTQRPVINLTICIGNRKENILVNLINREHFHYPMLIGIEALKKFNASININKKNTTLPNC
jgi:hypothetical protein